MKNRFKSVAVAGACLALTGAFASIAAASSASAAPAQADRAARHAAFKKEYGAFVDRMRAEPYAPPGFVVVVSDGNKVLFERAYGVRDASTRRPLTLDTPIYTASTTKSYVGLLAAQLDAKGVLKLDESLKDVWPDLALPDPLDPSKVTVQGLLSHDSGMVDNGANFRSNTVGDLNAANIPAHLAKHARPRQGFTYTNLGPFLYSMMVEVRTGRDWRDALDREVFRPLGLTRTTIRPQALRPDEVARCNTRMKGAWRPVPLKEPVLLSAGGGVYASGRDAGRWVRAFAAADTSARGRVSKAALARTWRKSTSQSNDFVGLKRDGYGLGWDLAEYEGRRIVTRSGGYTGCMSIVGFLPDSGLSIAVMSVGDGAAFPINLFKQAIDSWEGHPEAAARAASRPGEYTAAVRNTYVAIDAAVAPDLTARAAPESALQAYVGAYDDGDRLGRFHLRIEQGRLVAAMGPMIFDLVPTGEPDAFTGYGRFGSSAYAAFEWEPQPFKFGRDEAGRVKGMDWGQRPFARLP